MKKYIVVFFAIAALLPNFAMAAWWNPFSWSIWSHNNTSASSTTEQDKIDELTQKIDALEKALSEKQAVNKQAPVVSSKVAAPSIAKQTTILGSGSSTNTVTQDTNPDTYSKVSVSVYTKNPGQYLSKGLRFWPITVNDFMAPGDRGGTNGYIEGISYVDSSLGDKIMMKAVSALDYQKIVAGLQKGDTIKVYGVGAQSETFLSSSLIGASNVYNPIILVQRIEKCSSDCSDGSNSVIYNVIPQSILSTVRSSMVTNGANNNVQRTVKADLIAESNHMSNNDTVEDVLINGYNASLGDYYIGQFQMGRTASWKSYATNISDTYQKYIDAIVALRTIVTGADADLGQYKVSTDLSLDQQDDLSMYIAYIEKKIAEYGTKIDTLTQSLKKYRDATSYDSSMIDAPQDIANLKQYLETEKSNFEDQINNILSDFVSG